MSNNSNAAIPELGDSAIQNLQGLCLKEIKSRKTLAVKETVQLVKSRSENKGCFTIICGDKQNFFPFIFRKQKDTEFNLKDLDIVEIQQIATGLQNQGEVTFVLCTKYEKVGSANRILYPNAAPIQCNLDMIFDGKPEEKSQPRSQSKPNNQRNRSNFKGSKAGGLQTMELKEITSFSQNFCVKVKCTKKFPLKDINGKSGPLKCLTFHVSDKSGYEMEATCFGDKAEEVDKVLEEGKCVQINQPYTKLADKKYSTLTADYKLCFSRNTTVEPIDDDGGYQVPEVVLSKFEDLNNIPLNSSVNVLCILLQGPEHKNIQRKDGSNTEITNLYAGDISGYKVPLQLWGEKYTQMKFEIGEIYLASNFRVKEFRGRNLSSVFASELKLNPNLESVNQLKNMGVNFDFKELPQVGDFVSQEVPHEVSYLNDLIKNLESLSEGVNDDTELKNKRFPLKKVVCTLTYILHNDKSYYESCSNPSCKRKKLIVGDGAFHCTKCDKNYDNPQVTYALSCKFKDASGEQWLKFFGDLGEQIVGVKPEEYKRIVETDDKNEQDEISQRILLKKYCIYVKPKIDTYNNTVRPSLTPVKVERLESDTDPKITKDYYDVLANNLGVLLKKEK